VGLPSLSHRFLTPLVSLDLQTQLDDTVGIHPTHAEELVQLDRSKRSGEDVRGWVRGGMMRCASRQVGLTCCARVWSCVDKCFSIAKPPAEVSCCCVGDKRNSSTNQPVRSHSRPCQVKRVVIGLTSLRCCVLCLCCERQAPARVMTATV